MKRSYGLLCASVVIIGCIAAFSIIHSSNGEVASSTTGITEGKHSDHCQNYGAYSSTDHCPTCSDNLGIPYTIVCERCHHSNDKSVENCVKCGKRLME